MSCFNDPGSERPKRPTMRLAGSFKNLTPSHLTACCGICFPPLRLSLVAPVAVTLVSGNPRSMHVSDHVICI